MRKRWPTRRRCPTNTRTELPLSPERFDDALATALSGAASEHGEVVVVVADLDRRLVKSGLGRSAADSLLVAAARRVVDVVAPTPVVGRLRSDELAVAVCGDRGDADGVIEAIRHALAEPFSIDGCTIATPASIGVARFPVDGESPTALVDSADRAMEVARQRGGGHVAYHAPGLRTRAVDRIEVEAALRRAIDERALSLAYQPRVDLATGRIWGAEALLRWRDDTLGEVSPATFVPVAEESGLIAPLGEWVVDEACRQLRCWDDAGLPRLEVSVNVSVRQFDLHPFVEIVATAIDEHGLAPARVEVELTETAALLDADVVAGGLHELRQLGVGCAIDDFGTGYSCLRTLSRLPFSGVKIDRAFVQGVQGSHADPARTSVTLAVLELARGLGLRAVAEGVETSEQLAFLQQHGCEQAQGYLFSPALPAPEFERFVRDRVTAESTTIDLRDADTVVARRVGGPAWVTTAG